MSTAWMWIAWGAMAVCVGVYGWVWRKAGAQGRRWLEWGLAALVAGVSLASVLTHEPWRDELHNWLVTRELTPGAMWHEMRWEGHFLPWHLILHPLARLGAPVWTMGLVAWTINAATVAWFARKAPLGGWAKAAVALSCLFLYVNPTISRCYVLVPPIMFGLAALWWKRNDRPVAFGMLVALLANTHVCMEGTAGLVFMVFAWENVFKRTDGKNWKECGRQLAGLGVMTAGGLMALVQVLPTLWDPSCFHGLHFGWRTDLAWFFQGCHSWMGIAAMLCGLTCLGVLAWRRDKGIFAVYAGSLAYMAFFSVVLYPAHVVNRALLWWPVAIGMAWALELAWNGTMQAADIHGFSPVRPVNGIPWDGGGMARGNIPWIRLAVILTGLGLIRPDMTWADWREEFDVLPGFCRIIEERYGRDAEVWIDGMDECTEGVVVYLENVMDWQTGRRAERNCQSAKRRRTHRPFAACRESIFRTHPDKDSFLAVGSMSANSGLTIRDIMQEEGIDILEGARRAVYPWSAGVLLVKAWRGISAGKSPGQDTARVKLEHLAMLDPTLWEVMNNLAWLCVEEGRVGEARTWMDRAMANEAAKENAGVWDTEAVVRRAEGDEEGARAAEALRDQLKSPQYNVQNSL